MDRLLLVPIALALACSTQPVPPDGGSDGGGAYDAGRYDAGPYDAGPYDAAVEPGFAHCPPASAYVGDPSWQGRLTSGGALFCVYPRMFETAAEARPRKLRMMIVDGTYPFPLAAAGARFRLPMCIEQRGATTPPEILEGTVGAERRQDFEDFTERYFVESRMPLSDGSGEARFALATALDRTSVDLSGTISSFRLATAAICSTKTCGSAEDRGLLPCRLASNTCDELEFTGGSVTIDQFHWAGQVGAGFAAAVRVRGSLDGADFDIADYHRMTVTYGHHAFSRGLELFFDAPIGGACGLSIAEISESSATDVTLIDCDGTPMGTRTLTSQSHLWQAPCR